MNFAIANSHGCPKRLHRQAFTLIELLVVVSILAVLVALLLPTLNAVRRQAENVNCASNQRQIGLGILMYAGQNGGWLPFNDMYGDQIYENATSWFTAYSWPAHYSGLGLLYKNDLVRSSKIFWCPSIALDRKVRGAIVPNITFTNPNPASTAIFTTYFYRLGLWQTPSNNALLTPPASWSYSSQSISTIKYPDDALVFCGARGKYGGGNVGTQLDPIELHYYQGFNILFVDGSVQWFSFKLHPNFPVTTVPQCGQSTSPPNAPGDSGGNRYRPDIAWATMRRAALVYHNAWTNPNSSPKFAGGVITIIAH